MTRVERRSRGLAQHDCRFCFARGIERYIIGYRFNEKGERESVTEPRVCRCLTRQAPGSMRLLRQTSMLRMVDALKRQYGVAG